MKKLPLIMLVFLMVFAFCLKSASAQLLLEENFNFTGLLTANGWTAHSSGGTSAISTAPGSLSYTNYLSSGVGNMAIVDTAGEDINRTFTQTDTGSVYVSFLANVQKAKATGDYFMHIGPTTISTTFRGRVFVKYDSGTNKIAFGLAKFTNTPDYTAFNYDLNTTYLLVMKYTFFTGDDSVYLYVNPIINGMVQAPLLANSVAGNDLVNAGSVALRQGAYANDAKVHVDGIRIGKTWKDILPFDNSGIFERYIVTNTGGTDTYTEGVPFNGSNLGNFAYSDVLTLKGGQVKTWKNVPPDDITGARMFYRVYLQGNPLPVFTSINLPWLSNTGTLNDQIWENITANVNILSGLTTVGTYNIETYFEADYTSSGVPGTHVDNNGGLYYKATFALTSVPCVVYTIPFTEGFNAATIPTCWSQIKEGGATVDWTYVTTAADYPTAPYEGTHFAYLFYDDYADSKVKLVSPPINLAGAINPSLSFRHYMKAWDSDQDELRIFYRTSSTSAWVLLQEYTSNVDTWTERVITLPNGSATYQVAFEGNAIYGYGVAIDDVKIDQPPANDMAVIEWLGPLSGCGLTENEHIVVKVKNMGSVAQTGVPIVASVDGGNTIIGPEILPGTIQPGQTITYTFTAHASFSAPGIYYCGSLVVLSNDVNHANDTVITTIYTSPTLSTFPYTQNFDLYSGWIPGVISGTQQWELGLPAQVQLHTDFSGINSKAWMTKLTSNYDNGANVYLMSPCLNFTNLSMPMFSVYLNIKTELNWDAMVLESSVDGGATWEQVEGDAGFYNNTSSLGNVAPPKWSGTNGDWTKYETSLSNLAGEPNVKLRFRFESDGSTNNEGIAIDEVRIYEPLSKDVGATAVFSPVNSICGSANDTLKIVVKNYGFQAQTTIPVKIKVVTPNTTINITDTLFGNVLFNQKDTLISLHTINTLTPGVYNVTVNTALTGDLDAANDTTFYSFTVNLPNTIPYLENFQTTAPGWQHNMSIDSVHGSPSKVLYENLYSGNKTAFAQSPKVGTVSTGDFLLFDYRIVNWSASGPWPATTLGAGDTIKVMISNDCGASFNILDTIYDSKHTPATTMATKQYSLNAYDGDDIIVKFDLQRQTAGDYYVDIDNVIIGSVPVVDLGPDTSYCTGSSITLDAGNVTPYTTYNWSSVPPGFSSTLRNITVSPTVCTEFIVVVNNGFGMTDADTIVVCPKVAPVVNLGADKLMCSTACITLDAGLEVSTFLTEGLRGTLATNWTMNDAGGLVVEQSSAGGFMLLDDAGDWVVTDAYNLTGLPNVKLYVDIASYGSGVNNLMLIDVSNDNGATWSAQFPFVTDTTVNSSYLTKGPFSVTATGTQVKFRFRRPATSGKGIRFRDFKITTSTPYTAYLWSTGATTQTISACSAGDYWAEVVASNGCTDRDTVNVAFYTVQDINFGLDTAICAGETLTLNAGSGFTSYLWSDNSTLQTLDVTAAGTFWVQAQDSHGCTEADTISVILSPLPVVDLGVDTSVCSNVTYTLDAGAGINYSYIWKKTGSPSVIATTQTLVITTPGTYYVVVNNGCSVTATDTAVVSFLPAPYVNLGVDTTICPNDTLNLNAGIHTAYLWNDSSVDTLLSVTAAGIYSVTVTDANACTDVDSITVSLHTAPIINLGGDTTICVYDNILLNAGAGFTSYLWFDNTPTQTLLIQGSVFGIGVVNASVVVTDNHTCTATDTMVVTIDACTGVNETASGDIQIYPNPSNGLVYIELNNIINSKCEVSVYNVQGQLVKSQEIISAGNSSVFELDLRKQAKGVYFIKTITGTTISMSKIVVN